jgi:hypothetical protein
MMKSQTALLSVKQATLSPESDLWRHAAVRPLADHEVPLAERPPRSDGRDFSRVPVHASGLDGEHTEVPCHLTLHRCPFGGACHTCPTQVQTKLTVNEPGDMYEQEADRVANQVMAMPAHSRVSGEPPRILPIVGQSTGRTDPAPLSVDHALASPGTPLEPALRQDMERRFGYDFSRVRVHTNTVAEESAQDVNALAYTVGHNIVFGAGRFASRIFDGCRLLAHELTHVLQQSGADRIRFGQCDDKGEPHISTMTSTSSAMTPVVQRYDLGRLGQDEIVLCEPPTQAGQQLQAALRVGISPDRRHDEGLVLLNLLPGLANILDPDITAARDHALIVNIAMAWHPASYGNCSIPTPYVWALWDYYKARWESEDLRTRRRHIDAGQSHWHSLMLPRLFNDFVAQAQRSEIRSLVSRFIETPARRLRNNTIFDVLSHDGRELTADQRVALERRRTEARERRRRGGGIGRSETMDVAPGDVRVTSGQVRTVRYINPDALRFVPHRQNVSPRRTVFTPLASVLNELRTARASGDAAAIAAAEIRLTTEEEATRQRIRDWVSRNRPAGAARDVALASINALDLTVDVEVRSHDVDIGSFSVQLEPVEPGALIERPGGFSALVTEIATGRSVSGRASEEVMNALVSGFSGDERVIARQFLEVIRLGEGSLTSLNTWDRTRITLGSGIAAAGVLQDMYAMFQRDDPVAYERIFGRHGIGIVARGVHGDIGSGQSLFRTTGEEGRQLVGDEAREQLANDPRALAVMVTAGFDPAWQSFLLRGGVNSIRRGLSVTFRRGPDGAIILAEGGEGIRVYDWLHGRVSANMLSVAIFSFALDFHASNSLRSDTVSGFGPQYNAAAEAPGFDPANPASAPDEARRIVARWLVNERRHRNREAQIKAALGLDDYAAITGG